METWSCRKACIAAVLMASLLGGCISQSPRADIEVHNARIFIGTAEIIEHGTVLIRGDRITSVAAGRPNRPKAKVSIDARGMTLLPGLIDTHVHLLTGPKPAGADCEQLYADILPTLDELLNRGFTTVMSVGDPASEILTLRDKIARSEIRGPALLVTGPALVASGHPTLNRSNFCNNVVEVIDSGRARERVFALAAERVDGIKVVYDSAWPPSVSDEILRVISDEAHLRGLPVLVHVQTAEDAAKAVRFGADRLVHFPRTGSPDISLFLDRHIPLSSTVHLHAPIASANQMPVNHGGRELDADRLQATNGGLDELLGNVRSAWDKGVILAFGTDRFRASHLLQTPEDHEMETLSKVLSASEIILSMTRDAARFLSVDKEIGTVEAGKRADLILVDGIPDTDIAALSRVELVVSAGRIVHRRGSN